MNESECMTNHFIPTDNVRARAISPRVASMIVKRWVPTRGACIRRTFRETGTPRKTALRKNGQP